MTQSLEYARAHFIQGMSRIAAFWGFPRAMGAIYGAIYLSREPIGLDELVKQVGVSKGAVSTNVRNLEQMRVIRKHIKTGDRKDYYYAEEDFWKVIRNILQQREKNEFDHALRSVGESLDILNDSPVSSEQVEEVDFQRERLQIIQRFFKQLDHITAAIIAIDDLRMSSIAKLFKDKKKS